MYGLIVKLLVQEGKREELAGLFLEGADQVPGLKSFVVANDPNNPQAVWITEVWESKAHHQASFALPMVQASNQKAEGLMLGMELQLETEPIAGLF